jgi:uncharacterized protein
MDLRLRERLVNIAKKRLTCEDVSHDVMHTLRVLKNAEMLVKKEGGDPDIVIPAALFHDIIVYPKDHKKSHMSQLESAYEAENILKSIYEYPKDKIKHVKTAISECSFSKNTLPSTFESKILQDADKLDSTGVISIMRTFSSSGQMKRPFYHDKDPFCKHREPDSKRYALDLFYNRLLVAKDRMHTKTAEKIAKRRTDILKKFLKELEIELKGK